MRILSFKYLKVLAAISIVLSLSACWDYTEIERRGYILGIAIDKAFPIPKGNEDTKEYINERDLEKIPTQLGEKKYAYTVQIPLLPQAQNKPSGQTGGGGTKEKTWELTILGNSFFEANREYSTRTSTQPFYEHLQVLVISEDVAKDGLGNVLDIMIRDPEMRRRTRVFITPKYAKGILDVQPRIEDFSSQYLRELPYNASKTSRILHKTDLGEVSESIHANLDFVLPRIISTEDEIKNAGSAVFKKDKMVGWLGEIDTIYLKWIRNAVLGGIIVVEDPMSKNDIITLEIKKAKTKITPISQGEDIVMKIKTKAKFNIAEESRSLNKPEFNEKHIKLTEKKAQEKIEREMDDTIKYIQRDFRADIFHFSQTIQQQDPDLWNEVKDDWDNIFPKIKTQITVDVDIDKTGLVK